MKASYQSGKVGPAFRTKVLLAMMLVVSTLTAVAIYFAERSASENAEQELERRFQTELDAVHAMHETRQAVLLERCRALVGKARIHAALEDGALDLLYPNAEDELRDVMNGEREQTVEHGRFALQALFYRFLDRNGAVIVPPNMKRVGVLQPEEEARLALPGAFEQVQLGYLARQPGDSAGTVSEVIATPILSGETGEVIAALVLGFRPTEFGRGGLDIKSGLWIEGKLWLASVSAIARDGAGRAVAQAISTGAKEHWFEVMIDGIPSLLFYKRLNPGSLFPEAYEVCVFSLEELSARRAKLRWQIGGVGLLLMLGGLGASNFVSIQLSRPVERLEHDSAENLEQRRRVEAALDLTSEELQRSMRFSADASHQLKTPVTVLRAGLEELLADENIKPEAREELSALIHQTLQLTSIIEDLLLLSRMDAGHLQIEFESVNLAQLIEAWIDDLGAQSDALQIAVENEVSAGTMVLGEKRYTSIILQNLLENARKYNLPKGRIRIAARENVEGFVLLTIANTGRVIPLAAQPHIFERFHRGVVGENIPGHGLGLNLARELARLHHGDLRLVRSDEAETEFELKLLWAKPAASANPL